MIGLVVFTHARLGRELVSAAEFILGRLEQTQVVSVEAQATTDALRQGLETAVAEVDAGDGVLVLTDMFGGTPNNIALAYLEEGKVEVATGVNLPMLIKAAGSRQAMGLADLGRAVCQAGRSSISLAGEILKA